MVLGFHYHIPFSSCKNENFVPGHFGIFIEELAENVDELVLFLFFCNDFNSEYFDYRITRANIKIVKVSENKPAYIKYFFARVYVLKHTEQLKRCSKLLLRGPSPMSYAFAECFSKADICNLVVGDYMESLKFLRQPFYRLIPIKVLNYLMHKTYLRALKGTAIAFNSEVLFEKYKNKGTRTSLINTGNIRLSDISVVQRPNLKNKPLIKFLYVGRIDWAKGFEEMVNMLVRINEFNWQRFELHIVGWDESKNNQVLTSIKSYIQDLNILEFVIFHGKKQPGIQLNSFYKLADIFLLPSYQEGFPRTIWEAFANNLPVITTPVGSIPLKICNYKHALFCEIRSSNSLFEKVIELIENEDIYQNLIKNGLEIARRNTIESQIKSLVEFIEIEN